MIPVVLSGGSGTRLWPVSRQTQPKQFCEFFPPDAENATGATATCLFEQTVERVRSLGNPMVVTVRDLKVLTEKSLKRLGVAPERAIYEPFGRNTAPAIALVCRVLQKQPDEIVGIFPADHLIGDGGVFSEAAKLGEALARQGHIVTLGVTPDHPATGYGYIETSGAFTGAGTGDARLAIGFREKPDLATAQSFLKKGGYFWNAGMFIFKVSDMIAHLKAHAPDIWAALEPLRDDRSNLDEIYRSIRAVSIDYAVMEKLARHVCVPCRFDWTDLGSWDAMAKAGLATGAATTVQVAGSDNFVSTSAAKSVAFVGVDDLIIVDTADALLVARKGSTEKVKDAVEALAKTPAKATAVQHAFDIRPWGRFDVIRDSDDYKLKSITVDPGAQISYQSHAKRAEHWIITSGRGEVILDEDLIPVDAGQHVFIPIGAKHRIRNTGTKPLQFIEVQIGTYFGEDDIVRYQDDYQRLQPQERK